MEEEQATGSCRVGNCAGSRKLTWREWALSKMPVKCVNCLTLIYAAAFDQNFIASFPGQVFCSGRGYIRYIYIHTYICVCVCTQSLWCCALCNTSMGQLAAAFGANADVIILIIRHVVRTSCTNKAESTLQARQSPASVRLTSPAPAHVFVSGSKCKAFEAL